MLLSQLQVGQSAVVQEVLGEGFLSQRLLEMGIIRGSTVEIVRLAPMGDPIDIKVRGYHLSLRREEARNIQVSMPDGYKG